VTLLGTPDFEKVVDGLKSLPPRRAINPLLSAFYQGDLTIRWRAISAFGLVVNALAEEDMEAARVVMRRLMWSLNDESGGIGWGAPEAMGEIMACHSGLAGEFSAILVSYIREDGNFLEYEPLRSGALWGIARLADANPRVLKDRESAKHVRPYLFSEDPVSRALAAWAMGSLGGPADCPALRALVPDTTEVTLFRDRMVLRQTVGEIAHQAEGRLCVS
jgi:HEAT repeat protein